MKRILFTGGTGFLGRNLIPHLSEKYEIIAPKRTELDLRDITALENFIKKNSFDVIIHAAIPNIAFNKSDREETLLKDSLLTFMKLHQMEEYYGKLIYFGSGAEFDKSHPIISVTENDFGKNLPQNDYGLAKYIMNEVARKSKKIYNLRIFGCYGPTDANFKLITYAIQCCIKHIPINLRQNCIFDYMSVFDLLPVLEYFIENEPMYHDYNICTGQRAELVEICKFIQEQMNCNKPIHIEMPGFNNEYTAQNVRICEEIPQLRFTSLFEGIKKQIDYEKGAYKNEEESC